MPAQGCLSLLNASFGCKGLPTQCENGRTSIIDYLITAPDSLLRVQRVHVECVDQASDANALGSDHNLLFVDWKLTVSLPLETGSADHHRLHRDSGAQAFQAGHCW
eukprot:TRINITY_DN1045_c0_g1_i1.p2 TRINITY_DN1045_c0_g1~~TRINITY_DN1045_c0_g1_i1.p2  ORF type:complete len:106 (+),score=5.19 TRINITY_DN1045_c0_g1_i1:693-1010(+)